MCEEVMLELPGLDTNSRLISWSVTFSQGTNWLHIKFTATALFEVPLIRRYVTLRIFTPEGCTKIKKNGIK